MKRNFQWILLSLILLLGISIRAWNFGSLPSGLNQDEASSAVDAYYLYHYGVDRNGISYPVHFIAWGSGQSLLYGYLLIPFVASGLNPITTRLPMLLLGVLSLPIMYLVGYRTAGRRFALIAMFLLAVSPWHIMMSRWGLEDNTLPFVFLVGYLCMLLSTRNNHWYAAGCVFFALCFYAYGSAYVAVPVFLIFATWILLWLKRVHLREVILGAIILVVLCTPIALFILVNSLKLDTIHIGLFTIPRFPVQARYEAISVLFGDDYIPSLLSNIRAMLRVLIQQTDGLIWNALPAYGYFYKVTFPLALIGLALSIKMKTPEQKPERFLLLAWLVAALAIGTQIEVNINRINLIFPPLILCIAFFMEWLAEYSSKLFALSLCAFLVGFAFFARDYFGAPYQERLGKEFFAGFLPAVDFALQGDPDKPVCVTDKVNMPYIYVLFSEKTNPVTFLNTVKYVNNKAAFRQVRSFDRFTFGLKRCRMEGDAIYILRKDEVPPERISQYKINNFIDFNVYIP